MYEMHHQDRYRMITRNQAEQLQRAALERSVRRSTGAADDRVAMQPVPAPRPRRLVALAGATVAFLAGLVSVGG